ncbi:hypothetical protein SAMD00023353_4200810 [Rosellinia necatrix]|uniref:Uncharacterized protein n=1 Tax=Rosellinia necatrix TaxID=77044 RepID=A0A1W2TPA3_ROSNE|nr:hypothetical protein SAMD00023353_4200810 [Rosellinia necatrix]
MGHVLMGVELRSQQANQPASQPVIPAATGFSARAGDTGIIEEEGPFQGETPSRDVT